MQTVGRLEAQTGLGIRYDSNAMVGSPRHILLADPEVYSEFRLPVASLRENLLVTNLESASLRSGTFLSVGPTVIRLTLPCEVCKKLNGLRAGLAGLIDGRRGWLARIVRGGVISEGDELRPHPQALPCLGGKLSERVHHVLMSVPEGRVITFAHLAVTTGVTPKHVRVFPRMLKTASSEVPVHRVVTSSGRTISQHVRRQVSRLRKEGVSVSSEGEVGRHLLWEGDPYRSAEHTHLYG